RRGQDLALAYLRLLAAAVAAVAGVAYAAPPVINSFTAAKTSIGPGQSTFLNWSATGAATLVLDNGIGDVTAAGGSTMVMPAATTAYTLTATNAEGSASARVVVRYIDLRPLSATQYATEHV